MFIPNKVFFEDGSLNYPLGKELLDKFNYLNIPCLKIKRYSSNFKEKDAGEFFNTSKKTFVIRKTKKKKLNQCKPSADYEFSIVKGCPGICEYCYLQTNASLRPFTRIYVNIDDILENSKKYITENLPNTTTFELSSLSDPLSVESYTGSVKKCVEFFSAEEHGKLRLVTKFPEISNLLNIEHNGRTKIRFSINSSYVEKNFEKGIYSVEERIKAASKVIKSGYPLGFIIAPIMVYEDYKEDYDNLFKKLSQYINKEAALSFELIQYRFTLKSKKSIIERFPNTKLELDESERIKKWGPFGNYKYVYPKDIQENIKSFFTEEIRTFFPNAVIEYFT